MPRGKPLDPNDIVGKRFGHCVVVEYDEALSAEKTHGSMQRRWYKCLCDCGEYFYTSRYELSSRHKVKCNNHTADIKAKKQYLGKNCRNKTGYTGVWQNPEGKYCATCGWNGKQYFLGRYNTAEEAASVRERFMDEHNILKNINKRIMEED